MSQVAVLFDLDGVLARFVDGVIRWHSAEFGHADAEWNFFHRLGVTEAEFWKDKGFDFWSSLGAYEEGFDLLSSVAAIVPAGQIGLLSSPCETDGCYDGKRAWVRRHLPLYLRRFYTGNEKKLISAPCKVLVDDSDYNVDHWVAAGGVAVMPPRPWNRRRAECLSGGRFDPAKVLAEFKLAYAAASHRVAA